MSITVNGPVSGKPIVIENPLLAEHVEAGRLLWYSGITSCGSWNCPAVIVRVDHEKELFLVRSLDDMKEQPQVYTFSVSEHAPFSRQSMRLATADEVREYLGSRKQSLERELVSAKKSVEAAQGNLEHFEKILATLKL